MHIYIYIHIYILYIYIYIYTFISYIYIYIYICIVFFGTHIYIYIYIIQSYQVCVNLCWVQSVNSFSITSFYITLVLQVYNPLTLWCGCDSVKQSSSSPWWGYILVVHMFPMWLLKPHSKWRACYSGHIQSMKWNLVAAFLNLDFINLVWYELNAIMNLDQVSHVYTMIFTYV